MRTLTPYSFWYSAQASWIGFRNPVAQYKTSSFGFCRGLLGRVEDHNNSVKPTIAISDPMATSQGVAMEPRRIERVFTIASPGRFRQGLQQAGGRRSRRQAGCRLIVIPKPIITWKATRNQGEVRSGRLGADASRIGIRYGFTSSSNSKTAIPAHSGWKVNRSVDRSAERQKRNDSRYPNQCRCTVIFVSVEGLPDNPLVANGGPVICASLPTSRTVLDTRCPPAKLKRTISLGRSWKATIS